MRSPSRSAARPSRARLSCSPHGRKTTRERRPVCSKPHEPLVGGPRSEAAAVAATQPRPQPVAASRCVGLPVRWGHPARAAGRTRAQAAWPRRRCSLRRATRLRAEALLVTRPLRHPSQAAPAALLRPAHRHISIRRVGSRPSAQDQPRMATLHLPRRCRKSRPPVRETADLTTFSHPPRRPPSTSSRQPFVDASASHLPAAIRPHRDRLLNPRLGVSVLRKLSLRRSEPRGRRRRSASARRSLLATRPATS